MSEIKSPETNFNEISLLDAMPVGVVVFDAMQRVQYVNQVFERMGLGANSEMNAKLTNCLGSLFTSLKEDLQNLERGIMMEREVLKQPTLSGGEISVIAKGVPLFLGTTYSGGILVFEDLSISTEHNLYSPFPSRIDLEFLFSSAFTFCALVSLQGDVLYVPVGKDTLGQVRVLLGDSIYSPFPPETAKQIRHIIEEHSDVSTEKLLFTVTTEQGLKETYSIEFSQFTTGGNIPAILLTAREIGKEQRAVQSISSENAALKDWIQVYESLPDPIMALSSEGALLRINPAGERAFSLNKESDLSKVFGTVTGIYTPEFFVNTKQVLEAEAVHCTKISVDAPNGEKIFYRLSFSKVEGLTTPLYVCYAKNISQDERLKIELASSQEFLSLIFDNVSDLVCVIDKKGHIYKMNRAFRNIAGLYDISRGRTTLATYLEKYFSIDGVVDTEALRTKSDKKELVRFLQGNDQELLVMPKLIDFFYENEAMFILLLEDTTAASHREKEIRFVENVVNSAPTGIAVLLKQRIIYSNRAFALTFGYKEEHELSGLKIEAVAGVNIIYYYHYLNSFSSSFELSCVRRNESEFFAEFKSEKFIAHGEEYVVLSVQDISDIKKAQQVIKESEEKYRSLTDNIDDFFYISERIDGRLKNVFFTASVQKVTGYDDYEFIRDTTFFIKIIYPDDIIQIKSKYKKLLKNTYKNSEEFTLRIIHKAGHIVWLRNKITVHRDDNNQVVKIYGVVSNISAQVKADEERKIFLEDLQKLNRTKDRFISIISHDLRTPFSSILGFTEVLLQETEPNKKERQHYISMIRESSLTMLSLVNSLLDWTRVQDGRIKYEPKKTNLQKLVDKSISTISGSAFTKNITVINDVPEHIFVFIDAALMIQVYNNLLSNAMKFTPQHGSIVVGISKTGNTRFIESTVTDSGKGIKPEDLPKLFDLETKFTTVGTSGEKGTGFGLTLVKEIIEKHGGSIGVESRVNEGTTFTFSMPQASSSILLIDDNSTDRILYSKIMKSLIKDHEVHNATTIKEGFDQLVRKQPVLVVVEHTLPDGRGFDLLKQLSIIDKALRPAIIVLSSSVGESERVAYGEMGVQFVFKKPVNLNTLKEAVEQSIRSLYN